MVNRLIAHEPRLESHKSSVTISAPTSAPVLGGPCSLDGNGFDPRPADDRQIWVQPNARAVKWAATRAAAHRDPRNQPRTIDAGHPAQNRRTATASTRGPNATSGTNLGPPVRTASAPSRAKPDRARLAAQHPAPGERPPSQHATTGRAPHHIRHHREDPLVLGLGDKRGGPCANRDNLMLSPTKRHRKHHPPPMSIRPSKSPGNPAVLNQRVDQRPGVTGRRDPVRSPTPPPLGGTAPAAVAPSRRWARHCLGCPAPRGNEGMYLQFDARRLRSDIFVR
ncbi:MAG: hypothetical protein QOK20_1873 [Acidimicrobiaceae bacterium]|nr:hypothetical protein [Acidimicrobiaceae bacterium]